MRYRRNKIYLLYHYLALKESKGIIREYLNHNPKTDFFVFTDPDIAFIRTLPDVLLFYAGLLCSCPGIKSVGPGCKFQIFHHTLQKLFLGVDLCLSSIHNFGQQFLVLLPGMMWGIILQNNQSIPHLPCSDVIQILDGSRVLVFERMPLMLQSMLIGIMTVTIYPQTKFTIQRDNQVK